LGYSVLSVEENGENHQHDVSRWYFITYVSSIANHGNWELNVQLYW
jgi:hypothetical protein